VHPDNRNALTALHYHRQRTTQTTLNIIALDTSGSTLASNQLNDAKATLYSLCQSIQQQRQSIALLCFGNQQHNWVLLGGKVPVNIKAILNAIQAGGGTPLRQALLAIQHYTQQRKQMNPAEKQILFIITDGRSRDTIDDISLDNVTERYVLDSEKASITLNKARQLAQHLNAHYIAL
jgi:magnesium chelatase subunit D